MPDKQNRYRKRKEEQGFQRVEVLVPEASVPFLKAYARALRDAHSLGVEPPLFNGMKGHETQRTINPSSPDSAVSHQKPQPTIHAKKPKPDFSNGLF